MRTKKDVCRFFVGCFPNGLISLLIAQVLLLLGFALSLFTLLDCKFVVADVFDGDDSSAPPSNSTAWDTLDARTGFGFMSYQDASGVCLLEKWGNDEAKYNRDNQQGTETSVEETFSKYVDWLGPQWDKGRNYLFASLGGAFVVFAWVLTMMCIAHVRPLRILAAAIPVAGIVPLQLATLSILNSEFCLERNCNLGRSGIGTICASAMYFAGGIALLFTKNYTPKQGEVYYPEPLQQPRQEQRRRTSQNGGDVEMVDIVEDVSFVIEENRERRSSGHTEDVVIGDGLAEAQEIKPHMVFLHEDGEENNNHQHPLTNQPSPPYIIPASPPEETIPTVTDVRILDDGPKTKIAP